MDVKKWVFTAACAIALAAVALPRTAAAGIMEVSAGFSFTSSDYGGGNFAWSRRWGASAGYHITDHSEIEFSFQDVFDRTMIAGFEDTSFHDQIFSINWVQSLTGRDFPVQPYFKLGVGQLNRDASGNYAGGVTPPLELDSVTVVVGAGLRIYLTQAFGLRAEGTTYLTGGSISTWKDNFAVTTGLSLYF